MGEDNSGLSNSIEKQKPFNVKADQDRKSRFGCLIFPLLVIIFIILCFFSYFYIYPFLTPNKIRGNYMDAVITPDSTGSGNLWILTDGSFYFISGEKNSGFHSVGSNGIFCKTCLYLYDPTNNKVKIKINIPFDNPPPPTKLFYMNKKIWKVYGDRKGYEPGIYTYNPINGEEISNTINFIEKYTELKSGLSKMKIEDDPVSLHFETKDGQNPVFDISKEKMFKDEIDFYNSYAHRDKEVTVFSLGLEKSTETARRKLFLLTGPESELNRKNISESYFTDPSTLKFFTKSEATPILKDKYFLIGTILFQDDDCCLILHQNRLGKSADRLLSCADKYGNMLWTVSTEDVLFHSLAASEDNSFSDMFFIRSKVHASKTENLVLFMFEGEGVLGFEYKTGKILFEL
jgi:hypothetical protein